MSSNCPPQLQLSIQPTTTSFKRSFEEFGYDLESPVGPRAVNAGESGATHSTGNERHKRARSRTSLDSEANGSTGSSAASEASDGGNVGASRPTTTVEPPRLPTPVLPDVDMPSYPQEDEEESSSPRAAVALRPTHAIDTNPTNEFQLTLDRFNAFDREMEVLRQPEPNLSIATSSSSSSSASALVTSASPPVLPPLIIDPHRLSTETIDLPPEQSPLNTAEVLPLSVSVSGVNISSSSTLPDRSRESTSPPVIFRQNLDAALERLRSPSPLAPQFVFQDSPTTGDDEEYIPRHSPSHTIGHGPPTLPPIPPIVNSLHDNNSESSEQNQEPPRPHAVLPNPPTLPPIPSVSDGFPDTSNVWDDAAATPVPNLAPARVNARHEDLPFRPLSPEIPPGYIDFERDFGQWFHPAEDSLSTSSVSTSAATAGTERETFGHAPTSAASAMPTSPQSPSSPLSIHILRARQAVEERRAHLSSIAAADTVARRMPRSSVFSPSISRAGPSNTAPVRSLIQDEFGTMANPFSLGNTTRASLPDNVRPSSRYRHWEEMRRNSFEIPNAEEGWAQFRDRLANEIEDTEHRLRRRPRFLGDTAESAGTHSMFSSRPRSEPDTNADVDMGFPSLLRGDRYSGPQTMDSSSSVERRAADSSQTDTRSWLERLRRHRENSMVFSDDEADDVGPSEFLNQLFARVSNEDGDSPTRHSPPSTSRPNARPSRLTWPPADDGNSGNSTALPSPDDDMDRALWRPGGILRYAAPRRPRDRFQNARGRAPAAIPRPSASNSLVAESASEARRQADFDSIHRRHRSSNLWDDSGSHEEMSTQTAMDVDEEPQRPSRYIFNLTRRPSPPPLRRTRDDPPTHLAHLDFEDFSLHPTLQASHSNRDSSNPVSPAHLRVPNEHLASSSRTRTSTSNSRSATNPPAAARLPPAHSMVAPWELPDVSLPFGDLFETLGEGRSHLSHPQRGNTRRSESAPSLPHPDLGGTFTSQRYPSPDQQPVAPTDAGTTATARSTHVTSSSRPEPVNRTTPTAETYQQSLLERHRQYVLESQYDLLRLEEGYSRYASRETRYPRRVPSVAATHGSLHQNNAAASSATSPNGGGPSRHSPSSSASAFNTRQAPRAPQASRQEPPRPGYATFLPGPFRNTLRHAEQHVARTESSSRPSLTTTPPAIPEMPFNRNQRSNTESPFTSRPLPTESYFRARDTSSNMFSNPLSRRDAAREAERLEAAIWEEPDFTDLIERRDHDLELLRRRHQEINEARTRQLRDRAVRQRELLRASLQETSEMSGTMTVGERDADGNNSASGETGNRPQSRRRPELFRFTAGPGVRRTRFFSDYMRDEDLDLLSYESLLDLDELAGGSRPRATPADVLEKMEKSTYKEWKTTDSDTRCPICLDDYEPDDPVQKLTNCSHWLHQECLGQWLKSANTCPVCRGSVAEARPIGAGRSPRTRGAFPRVPGPGVWRHLESQMGTPPAGENPSVSRFSHPWVADNIRRTTRRRSRLAQPDQEASSASAQPATAAGTSAPASNLNGTGPAPSDSDDDQSMFGFLPHIYRRR